MDRIYPPTIILGGGFVGLFTALHLRQQNYSRPIVLIEQRDRFTFKPLLYELLTGELHPEQVCPRYTDLFPKNGITFVQDCLDRIALGSQTTYFNIPGALRITLLLLPLLLKL